MAANYPSAIFNPAVHTDTPTEIIAAAHVNALQDEVKAVENALGTTPQGIKIDVKTRINDIEVDIASGNRTVDSTLVPVGSTGTILQLFSWISNRIKAIVGKTNWYDAPTKSLETLNNDLTTVQTTYVSTAGTGLSKVGNTLSIGNVGTVGTYKSVTVNAQGQVSAGTNPNTLEGFGITDGNFTGNATIKTNQIWHDGLQAKGISLNGYQKLPSGIIFQWMTVQLGVANSGVVLTLPIPFPTGVWTVYSSAASIGVTSGAYLVNNSQVGAWVSQANTYTYIWAVGY